MAEAAMRPLSFQWEPPCCWRWQYMWSNKSITVASFTDKNMGLSVKFVLVYACPMQYFIWQSWKVYLPTSLLDRSEQWDAHNGQDSRLRKEAAGHLWHHRAPLQPGCILQAHLCKSVVSAFYFMSLNSVLIQALCVLLSKDQNHRQSGHLVPSSVEGVVSRGQSCR